MPIRDGKKITNKPHKFHQKQGEISSAQGGGAYLASYVTPFMLFMVSTNSSISFIQQCHNPEEQDPKMSSVTQILHNHQPLIMASVNTFHRNDFNQTNRNPQSECKQEPSIQEIMIGKASFEIFFQLEFIFSICSCSLKFAIQKFKVHSRKAGIGLWIAIGNFQMYVKI